MFSGREAILKVHSKGVTLGPEVDLKKIAARTPGFVGADLANIVNEAALLAARKDKNEVEMEDLDEAIDRVMAGLEKKNRRMNEKEKEIVAYHESGHAIVAEVSAQRRSGPQGLHHPPGDRRPWVTPSNCPPKTAT